MQPADLALLRATLRRDEGCRLFPYVDTVGKVSVGYGRNLSDNGISLTEADAMLDGDMRRHVADLEKRFPDFIFLDPVRQVVLANMCFNLGITRLAGFKKMWAAIRAGDYETAAEEMLDSKWADQVQGRATRLAASMASGELKA